jgi:hypothetical protein
MGNFRSSIPQGIWTFPANAAIDNAHQLRSSAANETCLYSVDYMLQRGHLRLGRRCGDSSCARARRICCTQ